MPASAAQPAIDIARIGSAVMDDTVPLMGILGAFHADPTTAYNILLTALERQSGSSGGSSVAPSDIAAKLKQRYEAAIGRDEFRITEIYRASGFLQMIGNPDLNQAQNDYTSIRAELYQYWHAQQAAGAPVDQLERIYRAIEKLDIAAFAATSENALAWSNTSVQNSRGHPAARDQLSEADRAQLWRGLLSGEAVLEAIPADRMFQIAGPRPQPPAPNASSSEIEAIRRDTARWESELRSRYLAVQDWLSTLSGGSREFAWAEAIIDRKYRELWTNQSPAPAAPSPDPAAIPAAQPSPQNTPVPLDFEHHRRRPGEYPPGRRFLWLVKQWFREAPELWGVTSAALALGAFNQFYHLIPTALRSVSWGGPLLACAAGAVVYGAGKLMAYRRDQRRFNRKINAALESARGGHAPPQDRPDRGFLTDASE